MKDKQPITIGEILYSVHEHYYYNKSISPAPRLEYIIVKGTAIRFIKLGYTQVVIRAEVDCVTKLFFYKTTELEKTFFREYENALKMAIQMAEEHDRIWGWCDGKLRRSREQDMHISEYVQLNLFDFIGDRHGQNKN